MNKRDRIVLQKIVAYCEQIRQTHQYFHDDQALFFDETSGFVYRNSVAMPVLQIGELAKRLSEEYLLANKDIPWRAIMGMRDIFAHHYGSVDYQELWQTTHGDIADLARYLQQK